MKKMRLFLAIIFAVPAQGFDVGFTDTPYLIKTKLSGKNLTDLSFNLCQVGGNEDKGECVKLSSCVYPEADIGQAAGNEKDDRLRDEFELLTTASY
jgi:hypothetical protein